MLTANVVGVQSMICGPCCVKWQGDESSLCWSCGGPGVPTMSLGSPGWNQPGLVGGYTESYGDG